MARMKRGARRCVQRIAYAVGRGFRDEQGFTTVGTVIALLLALSLLLSAAQVQRINAVSAEVQDVADAAALAAQNEVAGFMTVVRMCDAVVLTLSLTGIAATGLGVAALCNPATAPLSEPLLSAAKRVFEARDDFAHNAAEGLERLQSLLPFFSAASAASVAQANNRDQNGAGYLALALPFPAEGQPIASESLEEGAQLVSDARFESEYLAQAAQEAEQYALQAQAVKQRAYELDCGNAPGYCLYERVDKLSGLDGTSNPYFSSVDTWSFGAALKRAQAYYAAREINERPESSSVADQARSVLRTHFYTYAKEEVAKGYVREEEESFEAYFPLLPRNTEEMRQTSLYTDAVYPITRAGDSFTMHAWSGCPAATDIVATGSISQMVHGNYVTCETCNFTESSMGQVAQASTSIENGFEYHYVQVAQAAQEYAHAKEAYAPVANEVKERATGLFDQCIDLLGIVGGQRIDAAPPGHTGTVVLVVSLSQAHPHAAFENPLVGAAGSLGTRAALSASTLLADKADQQGDVISSLLDGLGQGSGLGPAGIVLDLWSGLLKAYADGQEAVDDALEGAIDAIPFASASGLGTWAAGAFRAAVSAVGLQPAKLDALKPVLVNSAHVAKADGSEFSARLISLKTQAIANPSTSTDLFHSAVNAAEGQAVDAIRGLGDTVTIARIELVAGGPPLEIEIPLPSSVKEGATSLVERAGDALRDAYVSITGVRVWE